MTATVNAGARLDRLPISSFHYRIFWLVGAGMFFDGYDLYVAGGVLASTVQSKFSTVAQNLQFISLTFVGMTLGALITGFVGDKFGRRFTYQINLLIFGLASLAAAFAQDMTQLIACRFVQGLGLGAEIVVGYSTLTEFVPPRTRGRWLSMMAFLVVSGFPATALLGYLIIPNFGWRPMFVIAGLGSLVVWYLRKNLPESPRWLEAQGRTAEAESLMQAIETEAASGKALPPVVVPAPVPQVAAADLLKPPLLQRLIVGCWVLITINTLIFGFVIFLPQFFLRQGLTITNSLAYTLVLSTASLVGCALGAYSSDRAWNRFHSDRRHLRADRDPVRGLHAGTVPDRDQVAGQRHLQHLRPRRHCRLALHRRRADGKLQSARRGLADDLSCSRPDRGGLGLGRGAAQPGAGGCRGEGLRAILPRPSSSRPSVPCARAGTHNH